jgi:hypothetical protein
MKLDFIPLPKRASSAGRAPIGLFILLFALLGGLICQPAQALPESCLNTFIKTGAVTVGPDTPPRCADNGNLEDRQVMP